MRLTAAQEAAVSHRGCDLLLSASAGSGKTEVLAQRVAGLVADAHDPATLDRLLVVTFTRAAAAEMRVRIGRMLRAAADNVADEVRRRHVLRQVVLVDS